MLLTVARGRTNTEIADELHISLSTVKTHLASLMAKLGARNRVEIAMWAYETRAHRPLSEGRCRHLLCTRSRRWPTVRPWQRSRGRGAPPTERTTHTHERQRRGNR